MWKKVLADVLTFVRAVLAVVIITLAIGRRAAALVTVTRLLLLAWITDFADGPLARSSGYEGSTWIGRHDIHIDVLIGLSLLTFLVLAGSINFYIALIYVLIWAVVFWRMGELPKATGALFQGPIYILFGLLALKQIPSVGVWLVLYVVVTTAFTWKRFTGRVYPEFIEGVREFLGSGAREPRR